MVVARPQWLVVLGQVADVARLKVIRTPGSQDLSYGGMMAKLHNSLTCANLKEL